MTDKQPYLVKLKGKGLAGTGVTEALAREMCVSKGRSYMAIVEVQVDEIHDKIDGQKVGFLFPNQFWPAEDPNLSDHLRELTRVMHQNNVVVGADGTRQQILLEESSDGIEPTVDAVIAANPGLKFHPYVSSQLSIDDTEAGPVCDVCGKTETDLIHHKPATDPFTVDLDTEGEAPDDVDLVDDIETDPYDEPHDFEQGPDDVCLCGAPYGNPIHLDVNDDEAP